MEKTLTIDGKEVRFKCTAGTLIRYRNQFGREFLQDLSKMQGLKDQLKRENFDSFSLAPFYDIIWVMAKTADDTIPDPIKWYDSFEAFPIIDVFSQLQGLLISTIKAKNSSAAVIRLTSGKRRKRRH